jgi:hypothetical protein
VPLGKRDVLFAWDVTERQAHWPLPPVTDSGHPLRIESIKIGHKPQLEEIQQQYTEANDQQVLVQQP